MERPYRMRVQTVAVMLRGPSGRIQVKIDLNQGWTTRRRPKSLPVGPARVFGMVIVTDCSPPTGEPRVTAALVGGVMLTGVHPPRSEPYSKTCVVSLAESSRRVKEKTKLVPEVSRVGRMAGSELPGLPLRTYSRRFSMPSLSGSAVAPF